MAVWRSGARGGAGDRGALYLYHIINVPHTYNMYWIRAVCQKFVEMPTFFTPSCQLASRLQNRMETCAILSSCNYPNPYTIRHILRLHGIPYSPYLLQHHLQIFPPSS